MKINYENKMMDIINSIGTLEEKPTLLLHSCCAPCSSAVIEYLLNFFNITIFFYNPNITEADEYFKRRDEHLEFIKKNNLSIGFLEGVYDPLKDFFVLAKGMENISEGGERCTVCYAKRMGETAKKAAELNFEYFTTVLSISPLKNSQKINDIGEKLEAKHGVKYLWGDFKKKGRYLRSIELSRENNLYRQDYCGCIFSKREREENKKCDII